MSYFRKKPIVIEAVRVQDILAGCYPGGGELPAWVSEAYVKGRGEAVPGAIIYHAHGEDPCLEIVTLEGVMLAQHADWIIRGVSHELYPCKPDIFEKTYEAVDPTPGPVVKPFCPVCNGRNCADHSVRPPRCHMEGCPGAASPKFKPAWQRTGAHAYHPGRNRRVELVEHFNIGEGWICRISEFSGQVGPCFGADYDELKELERG